MSVEIHHNDYISSEFTPIPLPVSSPDLIASRFLDERREILTRSQGHYQFLTDTISGLRNYLKQEYSGDTMHNPNLEYKQYSRRTKLMEYRDSGEWEWVKDEPGLYVPHSRNVVIRDQQLDLHFHHINGTHWVEGEQFQHYQNGEVKPLGEFIDGLSGRETIITYTMQVWPDGHYVPSGSVPAPESQPLQVLFEAIPVTA